MEKEERGIEAVLRFPLPECQEEVEDAVNGGQWQLAMWELLEEELRRKVLKGEHEFKSVGEALEYVWVTAWQILEERGLKFHG